VVPGHIARYAVSWAGASPRLHSETPAGRAQRNRDALLATARAVFARWGTDVPLEVVAQEAGVGRGTLYGTFRLVSTCSRRDHARQRG